jgi:Protein of unknown function (DUF2924)
MKSSVEQKVESLKHLGLDGLRDVWRAEYGPPPILRSPELVRLMLAWRIQVSAYGGLDADTKRLLRQVTAPQAEGLSLGVGTKFQRIWNGQEVEVEVTEKGFLYDGKHYRSLSAAATAIAGVRWNGPRFFGLRDTKS